MLFVPFSCVILKFLLSIPIGCVTSFVDELVKKLFFIVLIDGESDDKSKQAKLHKYINVANVYFGNSWQLIFQLWLLKTSLQNGNSEWSQYLAVFGCSIIIM